MLWVERRRRFLRQSSSCTTARAVSNNVPHLLHMCHQQHDHHHHMHDDNHDHHLQQYHTTTITTKKTTIQSFPYPPNTPTDTPRPPCNPPPSTTGHEGHFSGSLKLDDAVATLPMEVINFMKQIDTRATVAATATGLGGPKKVGEKRARASK